MTPRQQRSYDTIRFAILDEAQGNVNLAFEDACARLAVLSEGVSWGAIRVPQGEHLTPPKPRQEALDVDVTEAPHG
jgi:hypothetical protein